MKSQAFQQEAKKIRNCGNILQKADWFGMPITLQYQGRNSYKTSFGGLMSIASALIIIGYFIAQVKRIFDQESTYRQSSFYMDTYTDNTTYKFNQSNYDIAISFVNNIPVFDNLIMEQYVQPRFYNAKFYFDGPIWTMEKEELRLVDCTEDRFLGNEKVLEQWKILEDFKCPENFEIELKGFLASEESSQSMIVFNKCDQEYLESLYPGQNLTCKTDAEIEFYISQLDYQVIFYNQYFDLSDYTDSFIKENMRAYKGFIHNSVHQLRQVYVSINKAVNYNSWYGFGPQNVEREFISTKFELIQVTGIDNIKMKEKFITIIMYMDPEIKTIERHRVTIIDVLSKTGGILGIVFGLLQISLYFYQRASLILELIQISFKFEDYSNQKSKVHMNLGKSIQEVENSQRQNLEGKGQQNEQNESQETTFFEAIKNTLNGRHLNASAVLILCRGILPCNNRSKQFKLYQIAKQRILEELDISNVLQQIRMVRIISHLQLNKSQRELLRFSKQFYISQQEIIQNTKPAKLASAASVVMDANSEQEIRQHLRRVLKASNSESKVDRKILELIAPVDREYLKDPDQTKRLNQEGASGVDPVENFNQNDFEVLNIGKQRKNKKDRVRQRDQERDQEGDKLKVPMKKKKIRNSGNSKNRSDQFSEPDNSYRELKIHYVDRNRLQKNKLSQQIKNQDDP